MACQKGGILVFLSFMWFHYTQSSSLSVPLLTWSNIDTKLDVPAIIAGQTKELSVAYKKHIEPLIKSKSLVLFFLQDELSADDFTKFASSFPHLQKILETKKYLLFPSVSKEKEGINELISGSASEIEYVDSSSLNDWNYKVPSSDTHNKIIVFHLEPVSDSHTKGKGDILERNDLIMHRIIKSLKEQVKDFGVVYSAEDASPMIANILLAENIADPGLASRHLLADTVKNDTETFFDNTCVMLYVTSIRHTMDKNTTEFIASKKQPWKVGGCGSNTLGCSISLTREGTFKDYDNVTLFIEFKNDTQMWYCGLLRFSGIHNNTHFESTFNCGERTASTGFDSATYNTIVAPIGMSFACQDLTFTADNGTSILILGGIQVQTMCDGKKVAVKQFLSAYHCVGFFSIEILTGIFVTIILMIGLYVGIMMMMAIQVQDRFDDPKGKTISMTPLHNE